MKIITLTQERKLSHHFLDLLLPGLKAQGPHGDLEVLGVDHTLAGSVEQAGGQEGQGQGSWLEEVEVKGEGGSAGGPGMGGGEREREGKLADREEMAAVLPECLLDVRLLLLSEVQLMRDSFPLGSSRHPSLKP